MIELLVIGIVAILIYVINNRNGYSESGSSKYTSPFGNVTTIPRDPKKLKPLTGKYVIRVPLHLPDNNIYQNENGLEHEVPDMSSNVNGFTTVDASKVQNELNRVHNDIEAETKHANIDTAHKILMHLEESKISLVTSPVFDISGNWTGKFVEISLLELEIRRALGNLRRSSRDPTLIQNIKILEQLTAGHLVKGQQTNACQIVLSESETNHQKHLLVERQQDEAENEMLPFSTNEIRKSRSKNSVADTQIKENSENDRRPFCVRSERLGGYGFCLNKKMNGFETVNCL